MVGDTLISELEKVKGITAFRKMELKLLRRLKDAETQPICSWRQANHFASEINYPICFVKFESLLLRVNIEHLGDWSCNLGQAWCSLKRRQATRCSKIHSKRPRQQCGWKSLPHSPSLIWYACMHSFFSSSPDPILFQIFSFQRDPCHN